VLTTLLIDDEPLAISRLQRLLLQFPTDFEVIGNANDGKSALELIAQLQPEIIFLDIEMPEMNGFELLAQLEHMPLVVFATAYDQYAIRAFEENSIDYLLKPIELERLEKTVEKLRKFQQKPLENPFNADLMALLETLKPKKNIHAISVKIGDRIIFIPISEIAYFEAEDKYVFLYTISGKKHLTNYTITSLENKLPTSFVRISRAAIVNTVEIKELNKEFNGNYVIEIKDIQKTRLRTGATYVEQLKKWMEL
jgi:two-component system, LytTR family, response regulator